MIFLGFGNIAPFTNVVFDNWVFGGVCHCFTSDFPGRMLSNVCLGTFWSLRYGMFCISMIPEEIYDFLQFFVW